MSKTPIPSAPHVNRFADAELLARAESRLRTVLEHGYVIVDTVRREIVVNDCPIAASAVTSRLELCRAIADRGRFAIIDDVAPLLLLGLPFSNGDAGRYVCVAAFVTTLVECPDQCQAAAASVRADVSQFWRWVRSQRIWDPRTAMQTASMLQENVAFSCRIDRLDEELRCISTHLLGTYEEISLLHRLSANLTIAASEDELAQLATMWLSEAVPAECVAVCMLGRDAADDQQDAATRRRRFIHVEGDPPLTDDELYALFEYLGPETITEPVLKNQDATQHAGWPFPSVREMISVPITDRQGHCGWIVAFNYAQRDSIVAEEFGAFESSLMSSVAMVLGIHSCNSNLYREQAELFQEVVRALTAAIDAKDPTTCGHSERVARISVLIARQLGLDEDDLERCYLAGLLHDIGKIGIDDRILTKPSTLTSQEYNQIKKHPELGHRILQGVKQLEGVLPVVLHHHEAWDGSGYPAALVGEQTPLLARICAVADAFDAMAHDRPYNRGLPLDEIYVKLQEGAGRQWDAAVVEALLNVREEVARHVAEYRTPQASFEDDSHPETASQSARAGGAQFDASTPRERLASRRSGN